MGERHLTSLTIDKYKYISQSSKFPEIAQVSEIAGAEGSEIFLSPSYVCPDRARNISTVLLVQNNTSPLAPAFGNHSSVGHYVVTI